jgi:peroxiredoxin
MNEGNSMSTKKQQPMQIGRKAHDFTLDDQNEKSFTLSDFKGKKILLSFHPLAWTSVCSKQMQSLEKNKKYFEKFNTIAVGISIDSSPCKNAWAKNLNIKNTKLLADFWPHGAVAQVYGIFNKKDGVSERVNIIVDENQITSFVKIYRPAQLPNIKEIIKFLGKNE